MTPTQILAELKVLGIQVRADARGVWARPIERVPMRLRREATRIEGELWKTLLVRQITRQIVAELEQGFDKAERARVRRRALALGWNAERWARVEKRLGPGERVQNLTRDFVEIRGYRNGAETWARYWRNDA